MTKGGADVLILAGPVPTQIGGGVAGWRQALEAGDRLVFALSHPTRVVPEPPVWSEEQTRRRLDDTIDRPVAGGGTEDASEGRRRVEAGKAQPVESIRCR